MSKGNRPHGLAENLVELDHRNRAGLKNLDKPEVGLK